MRKVDEFPKRANPIDRPQRKGGRKRWFEMESSPPELYENEAHSPLTHSPIAAPSLMGWKRRRSALRNSGALSLGVSDLRDAGEEVFEVNGAAKNPRGMQRECSNQPSNL